ncbi:MAG TPA: YciI family protein [Streptosporangiaceae bacterium]
MAKIMIWRLVELKYVQEKFLPVRARHRNYLAGLAREGKLGFAGRLADDTGSVFLYGAETEDELQNLMDKDPYVIENVITDRTIREFVPGVAFNLPPQDHYE